MFSFPVIDYRKIIIGFLERTNNLINDSLLYMIKNFSFLGGRNDTLISFLSFEIDKTFPAGFFGSSVLGGGPFVTVKAQITIQYVFLLFMLKDFCTASNFLLKKLIEKIIFAAKNKFEKLTTIAFQNKFKQDLFHRL